MVRAAFAHPSIGDFTLWFVFEVLDLEGTHHFAGQRSEVVLAAGLRLANIELTDDDDADAGTDLLGLTLAADEGNQAARVHIDPAVQWSGILMDLSRVIPSDAVIDSFAGTVAATGVASDHHDAPEEAHSMLDHILHPTARRRLIGAAPRAALRAVHAMGRSLRTGLRQPAVRDGGAPSGGSRTTASRGTAHRSAASARGSAGSRPFSAHTMPTG